MLQTPPPPLPVPAPVNNSSTTINNNNNIKNEDLYDPLKAEDEDEEDPKQKKSPTPKPTNRTFNIKKELTIKIEPSIYLLIIPLKQHFIYLFSFRSIPIN